MTQMKTGMVRRILGITALALWLLAIVPTIVLWRSGCRIVWQLENWAWLFAPVFTLVYAVILTVHISKCKHWVVKMAEWLGCTLIVIICIVTSFGAGILHNTKVWGDKNYVIYKVRGSTFYRHELYKRCGMVDRYMYKLDTYPKKPPIYDKRHFFPEYDEIYSTEYLIHEDVNLIQCDAVVRPYINKDSTFHATVFYRLDNGQRYNEPQNDSLISLINNQ
ncbi:MAG: hypothetical protein IJ789_05205 [Bacteroidales bacterium]|nr:hypothetical protein [Bacteroidales bacterium]